MIRMAQCWIDSKHLGSKTECAAEASDAYIHNVVGYRLVGSCED